MVRVTVSLPDSPLEYLDSESRRREMSRDEQITLAVRRERRRTIDAAVARARERFKDAGPFESADVIRADRGSHF